MRPVIATRVACPKCASRQVRRLSLVYAENHGGDSTELTRQASPPGRKAWFLWGLLAAVPVTASAVTIAHPGIGTLIWAGAAILVLRFAMRSRQYNADIYPLLYRRWVESFISNRSGKGFAPPSPS